MPQGITQTLIKPVENEGFWVPMFKLPEPWTGGSLCHPDVRWRGATRSRLARKGLGSKFKMNCSDRVHELKLANADQCIKILMRNGGMRDCQWLIPWHCLRKPWDTCGEQLWGK